MMNEKDLMKQALMKKRAGLNLTIVLGGEPKKEEESSDLAPSVKDNAMEGDEYMPEMDEMEKADLESREMPRSIGERAKMAALKKMKK